MIEIAMRRQGARLVPVDELSADSLVSVPADRDVLVKVSSPQNLKLLRFLWALAAKVAEACDHLHDREDAMDELKFRARHVKYVTSPTTGDVQIVPKSLTKLDGAGLSRLADRMIFIICRDIVPGLDATALKSEIMDMIGGGRTNNYNSSQSISPDAETDKPAAEDSPLPEVAGDQLEAASEAASSLPQGWEKKLSEALRRARKRESVVKYARDFFDELGAVPTTDADKESAKAIRGVFERHLNNPGAIDDELRDLI